MRKKLTRHGNSYALIIDRPLMELLGLDPDTEVEISTDGHSLLIRPVRPISREQMTEFTRALKETLESWDPLLEHLADR